MHPRLPFLLLVLAACGGDGFQSYYPASGGPSLDGLSPSSEVGSAGGGTAVLSGSGFGDDPNQITVAFGGRTAKILSVSDSELTVEVPRSNVEAGTVDVVVSLPSGRADLEDAYTYEVPSVYKDQTAYIAITNGNANGANFGGAEFLEFSYPRFHLPTLGWAGASETSDDWRVFVEEDSPYVAGLEDLYVEAGTSFELRNPALEGYEVCVFRDPDPGTDVTIGGDYDEDGDGEDDGNSLAAKVQSEEQDCPEGWDTLPADTMRFCVTPTAAPSDPIYEADWPFDVNFLGEIQLRSIDAPDSPLPLELDLPELGLEDVTLTLPATSDFASVGSSLNECRDTNEDGNSTLEDDAWLFEWEPTLSADELLAASDDRVTDVSVTVQVSLIFYYYDWLGLERAPVRAVASADDSAGQLAMPLDVLYRFPSSTRDYPGYMILLQSRFAEYTLEGDDGNTVVVSFVDHEFNYFTGWSNPIEGGGCGDCIDGDADGWLDGEDPDCSGDGEEEVGYSDLPCNDGIDNDDDGRIDSEEPECQDPENDFETNCGDGRDNDGDGFTDEQDGECDEDLGDGIEDGVGEDPDWQCSDGDDGDGDGWTDFEDPDCLNETDEETGYSDAECNDGDDNDGDGRTDADDVRCYTEGATGDESVTLSDECDDGVDNDGDGYTDEHDPGCELDVQGDSEGDTCMTEAMYPGVPACYDCEDNDGDGATDSDDDACVSDGEPDGYGAERDVSGP